MNEDAPPMDSAVDIDLDQLLRLRLVVARFGEMDSAGWWNTNGVLGRRGALLFSRGFPKTHWFAQARVVFEVARARCVERFPAVPNTLTFWALPARLEDEFDRRWAQWTEDHEGWTPFFEGLESPGEDLVAALQERGLLSPEAVEQASKLRRAAEKHSVPLPGQRSLDMETIVLLAAAFSRGEPGTLSVPYARVDD